MYIWRLTADFESADSHPISISLPLSGEIFSPERTKNFFEGLLPEGFSRRAVADWIKSDENDYLSKGNAPSTHIVKQSHVRFSKMVLNEQMCMLTAKELGIDVPESFIVNTGKGEDSDILYATRRYDRVFTGKGQAGKPEVSYRLHQEDFAQALGIPASEKYERTNSGYLRRMFELIRRNCTDPISAQNKLWRLICFNFMIGNTDGHIKNYSLLYGENLKQISLAPAYDIVCTEIYNMTDEMSFFIGDELNIKRMNRQTFAKASNETGMTERLAMRIFDEVAEGFENALQKTSDVLVETGFEEAKGFARRILECGGYIKIE